MTSGGATARDDTTVRNGATTRGDAVWLRSEERSGVLWLTLDRPAAGNALDFALLEALHTAVTSDAARGARSIVLQAEGVNFCVGGDIRAFGSADSLGERIGDLAGALHGVVRALHALPAPLVVGVRGWAAGAGFSLACLGDVLVCGSSARFKPAYPGLALTPDGGLTWTLPRILGLRTAADVLLRDRVVTASQALAWGLAAEVVDDAALTDCVHAIAEEIARQPAAAATRSLLRRSSGNSLSGQLDAEVEAMTAAARTQEAQKRMAGFLGGQSGGSSY